MPEGERTVTTRSSNVAPGGNFGARLRWWRERRGLSQLDLAVAADTPQRHVSFLESGRAAPSREMILRLAAALDLPLRQQNTLFLAAGYAPAWRESDLSAPELAWVNRALDYMLAQQEPYPAFVLDRRWNQQRSGAADHVPRGTTPGPDPRRAREPGARARVARWAPPLHRELGGGRPLFPPWRAGGRHRRRHARDGRAARSSPCRARCAGAVADAAPRRASGAGADHPFPPW